MPSCQHLHPGYLGGHSHIRLPANLLMFEVTEGEREVEDTEREVDLQGVRDDGLHHCNR